jgi:tetratricopeptide (TPR) repeat protein
MEIVSLYSLICDAVQDTKLSIKILNEALVYLQPKNSYLIHYNLGFLYSKLNLYQESLINYKKSIYITTTEKSKTSNKDKLIDNILINSINNIACLYRSLKCWNEAVYYVCVGLEYKNDDPDLLNNLGTIFTEMRRTDLSKQCYEKAYKMIENSIISNDKKKLKSEILLNLGHMYSYNGDNLKAIEKYNESLENNSKFPCGPDCLRDLTNC